MSRPRNIPIKIALPLIFIAVSAIGIASWVNIAQAQSANYAPTFAQCQAGTGPLSGYTYVMSPQDSSGNYTCTVTPPGEGGIGAEPTTYEFNSNQASIAGGTNFNTGGTMSAQGTEQPHAPGCYLIPGWFSFDDCMNSLLEWVGSLFLSIGVAAIRFAGLIFDTLITYTIVNFNTTLTTAGALGQNGAPGAIAIGWTLFRDIANILIIGMFVFIAINIILGNKTYGEKTLIAKVLIIAVLINFSLLFTELIIDGSNLTAYQFYNQMALVKPSNSPCANQPNGAYDISASFLCPMGITGIFGTHDLLSGVATVTGSGVQAFLYGLVGCVFLLGVAFILLYGCILIGMRAIMLIILMLTSSAAFATHLIPNLSEGKYSWSGWWKSLLNAAVLAPLLMIFLFISLLIVSGAQKLVPQGTNFGQFLNNPGTATGTNVWGLLLVYLLGTGLLYASFKISSSFASSIAGFDFMGSGLSKLASGTASLGSNGGAIARQTVGRTAYNIQQSRAKTAGDKRDQAAGIRARIDSGALQGDAATRALAKAEALERQSAARRNGLITRTAGNLASSKFGGNKSFASILDERTKAGAALAQKAAPKKGAAKNVAKAAKKEATEERNKGKQPLTAARDSALKERDAQKPDLDTKLQTETAALTEATKNLENATKTRDQTTNDLFEKTRGEFKDAAGNFRAPQDNDERAAAAFANRDDVKKEHQEIQDAQKQTETIKEKYSDAAIQDQIKAATQNLSPEEQKTVAADINRRSEEQRASELKHQSNRIENAQKSILSKAAADPALKGLVDTLNKQADDVTRLGQERVGAENAFKQTFAQISQLDGAVKNTEDAIAAYDKQTADILSSIESKAQENLNKSTEEIAAEIGRRTGSFTERNIIGLVTKDNERVADAVRSRYVTSTDRHHRLLHDLQEAQKEEHQAGGGGETGAAHP